MDQYEINELMNNMNHRLERAKEYLKESEIYRERIYKYLGNFQKEVDLKESKKVKF